jgi:hypothetical protein
MIQARQEISRTDVVTWSGKQLAAQIDDEVVLMNIEMGKYYGLDDIGSKIWCALEKPTPVDQLCLLLARQYEASFETIEKDVLVLLNKLQEQQLIVAVRP